jgi:hypothetical protein
MNIKALVPVGLLFLVFPAFAHDAKGPNGGRISDAGNYHVELVTKQRDIEIFISDSKDKPVAATGFKGLAILVVQGKPVRIPLEPMASDRLKGSAGLPIPVNAKGVVQLTAPDGKTAQAKFE